MRREIWCDGRSGATEDLVRREIWCDGRSGATEDLVMSPVISKVTIATFMLTQMQKQSPPQSNFWDAFDIILPAFSGGGRVR